ncbi:hypothetical protein ALC60_10496 [Trachymyrmex zeteki]|uniref:Uncharacterized protein n=1 Tax=Mycetomoellerius zeteki TaxID=64791 RepID=A0A151WR52_9HYME|nr:hypothetical protein ALC60_10496 [Trachymyrmex zeteki]
MPGRRGTPTDRNTYVRRGRGHDVSPPDTGHGIPDGPAYQLTTMANYNGLTQNTIDLVRGCSSLYSITCIRELA